MVGLYKDNALAAFDNDRQAYLLTVAPVRKLSDRFYTTRHLDLKLDFQLTFKKLYNYWLFIRSIIALSSPATALRCGDSFVLFGDFGKMCNVMNIVCTIIIEILRFSTFRAQTLYAFEIVTDFACLITNPIDNVKLKITVVGLDALKEFIKQAFLTSRQLDSAVLVSLGFFCLTIIFVLWVSTEYSIIFATMMTLSTLMQLRHYYMSCGMVTRALFTWLIGVDYLNILLAESSSDIEEFCLTNHKFGDNEPAFQAIVKKLIADAEFAINKTCKYDEQTGQYVGAVIGYMYPLLIAVQFISQVRLVSELMFMVACGMSVFMIATIALVIILSRRSSSVGSSLDTLGISLRMLKTRIKDIRFKDRTLKSKLTRLIHRIEKGKTRGFTCFKIHSFPSTMILDVSVKLDTTITLMFFFNRVSGCVPGSSFCFSAQLEPHS